MSVTFDSLAPGYRIDGPAFDVSRESIRAFCEASLDFNPLHLDDNYMQGSFGKTNFGGIIMHGMNNFGLITRMLTDWAYPAGAVHRRLETRWVKPVKPGDTIRPYGTLKSKLATQKSRWAVIDVEVRNQRDEVVATGEAMIEFPLGAAR
ncbi:MAG: MaoC family dehydratase [Pseudorhodoplanes sp.]|jgi:acyl dehydratase|nr:MaoC family dehydratase [Pseudorhodoplanes sp.]